MPHDSPVAASASTSTHTEPSRGRSQPRHATASALVIDPESGKVTDPAPPDQSTWTSEEVADYQKRIADLQSRVNNVLSRADRFDDNLAAAINTADGSLPSTPQGEASNVNQAARQANQVAAFRTTYGRNPASENDWRVAEALDPHSYNPKNQGVRPTISVLKITPVPGQGIVSTGLFIPGETVLGGTQRHLGDNRGFEPQFDAEDTRVTYVVDYENGYVIARQNPSVTSTGEVRVGVPDVKAAQLPDGTVAIDYKAADPFAPVGAAETAWSVNGQTVITPHSRGATISGFTTDYPSMETYQYSPDGRTHILHRDDAGDHTEFGPLANLPLHHDFGNYRHDIERFPQGIVVAPGSQIPRADGSPRGVPLGDPDHPPMLPGVGS